MFWRDMGHVGKDDETHGARGDVRGVGAGLVQVGRLTLSLDIGPAGKAMAKGLSVDKSAAYRMFHNGTRFLARRADRAAGGAWLREVKECVEL